MADQNFLELNPEDVNQNASVPETAPEGDSEASTMDKSSAEEISKGDSLPVTSPSPNDEPASQPEASPEIAQEKASVLVSSVPEPLAVDRVPGEVPAVYDIPTRRAFHFSALIFAAGFYWLTAEICRLRSWAEHSVDVWGHRKYPHYSPHFGSGDDGRQHLPCQRSAV